MQSNTLAVPDHFFLERGRTYTYSAYGLTIQSELPLPELATSHGAGDVTILLGKVEGLPPEARSADRYLEATDEGVYLAWDGVGAFLVRDGCEIIADPIPGLEARVLRLFLLGTTLAILLHQRGEVTALHASAAAIAEQSVGFIGDKGAGKSTMVGTLHARGHDLVADDIMAIDLDSGSPMTLPGFPHMKLWPDSVALLGHAPETLPRLRPELEKRGFRLDSGFSQTPLPLKSIYLLEQGSELAIEPLASREAFLALMPHWYGARFGMDLLRSLGLSTHFRQCADLANTITVYRLKRPRSMHALSEVARMVENHVSTKYVRHLTNNYGDHAENKTA